MTEDDDKIPYMPGHFKYLSADLRRALVRHPSVSLDYIRTATPEALAEIGLDGFVDLVNERERKAFFAAFAAGLDYGEPRDEHKAALTLLHQAFCIIRQAAVYREEYFELSNATRLDIGRLADWLHNVPDYVRGYAFWNDAGPGHEMIQLDMAEAREIIERLSQPRPDRRVKRPWFPFLNREAR